MAQDPVFQEQIQSLLLSGYVQEHLVVDYIEETTLAAAEIFPALCMQPLINAKGLYTAADPFVSLFQELQLRDVPAFDEPWAASNETLHYLRAAMPLTRQLRSEAIWHEDDSPYESSMADYIEPVLTRCTRLATLKLGDRGYLAGTDSLLKTIAPKRLHLPSIDEHVPPEVEASLVFSGPSLDSQSKEFVLSFLRPPKSAGRNHDVWSLPLERQAPQPLSIERPMSPPLFARAPSHRPSSLATLQDVTQLVPLTTKLDLPQEDMHAENMRVVSGWTTLVEPASPLPSTPPLTNGPSSDVDELESPTRPGRGRLFKLDSLAKDDHTFHSDMDPFLIPRERKPRQGKRAKTETSTMTQTLQPILLSKKNGSTPDAHSTAVPTDNVSVKTCLSDAATGLDSPLRLRETLQLPDEDPFNFVLREQLDDNPLMEVPSFAEPERRESNIAKIPLSALLSKRDGPTDLRVPGVLKKLPIKALSMDLTWRPVKFEESLPSFDDVTGQLQLAENSDELQTFLWSIPHDMSNPAPTDRVFDEPVSEPACADEADCSTLLTREERLRLKRQHSPCLSPDHAEDAEQQRPHKRPRGDTLSSDLISSESLFSPPFAPVSEIETPAASFPLLHSAPASQLPYCSQFSALSFGTDSNCLPYPLLAQVEAPASLPNSDIDMDDLSSIESFPSPEHAHVPDPIEEEAIPAVDHLHDSLAGLSASQLHSPVVDARADGYSDAIRRPEPEPVLHAVSKLKFHLPAIPKDSDGRASFDAPFVRFLRQMGKTATTTSQTSAVEPALPVEQPRAVIPSEVSSSDSPFPKEVLDMQPLLPPEWQTVTEFATALPPHRYLSSVEFSQKRSVVSVLAETFNVELVERDELAPSAYVHVQFDCDSCVIFHALGSLPTQDKALVSAIEGISQSVTYIAIVFECHAFTFTEPVVKALRLFRRALSISQDAMETIPPEAKFEIAFARTPAEAAAFVRMLGDAAQERGGSQCQLWDNRLWLRDDRDYEDERLVAALPSMNTFAAIVMLSRVGSWDEVLDMAPEKRRHAFGALVGTRRIDVVNKELDERIRRFAAEELQIAQEEDEFFDSPLR